MVIIKFVANHFPLNDSHLSALRRRLLAETKLIFVCLRQNLRSDEAKDQPVKSLKVQENRKERHLWGHKNGRSYGSHHCWKFAIFLNHMD